LTDTGQNLTTRNRQKQLVGNVVDRLKKYPNIIWEIANEPDFIPAGTTGVTVQDVMNWQNAMLQVVLQHDTTHIIAINGETSSSFGWQVPQAQVANLHYANNTLASQYGAVEVERNTTDPTTSGRTTRALGFNENNSIPDFTGIPSLARTADDMRAEAWEFVMNGGALADGYSLDRSVQEAQKASAQLQYLRNYLVSPTGDNMVGASLNTLDPIVQTNCKQAGNWCQGIKDWGVDDTPAGCSTANVYWATMKSTTDFVLYLHHGNLRSTLGGRKNDGYKEVLCGNGSTSGYRTSALTFSVPTTGCWAVRWEEPRTGVIRFGAFLHLTAGAVYAAPSPPFYTSDILFFATLNGSSC